MQAGYRRGAGGVQAGYSYYPLSAAYAGHGALGAGELLVDGGAGAREVELVERHLD